MAISSSLMAPAWRFAGDCRTGLVPSAGRQMVETAVRLARSFKPGAVPHPPKASPVSQDGDGIGSKPWSYGNVPPELK